MSRTDGREGRAGRVRLRRSSASKAPAESPAPPVLPALTFEHGKLVRKVSVGLYWPCKHCNVCTLQCLQGIEINFIRKNEEEEKLNNEEC